MARIEGYLHTIRVSWPESIQRLENGEKAGTAAAVMDQRGDVDRSVADLVDDQGTAEAGYMGD
jgi:hypothetical protein